MKTARAAALTLALGLGWVASAEAANPPAADSLTVTITPNAYYALDITTGNVVLNLGSVNLGASTQTVSPATVTVTSTYATTDFKLRGNVITATDPWVFDSSSVVTSDRLSAWATFTTTARSSAPAQGTDYFRGTTIGAADSDLIDTTDRDVGNESGGANSNFYEAAATAFAWKNMDGLATNDQSHLWLWFRTPWSSTSNGAQQIMITLTAGAPVN